MPRPEDKLKDRICDAIKKQYGDDVVFFKINDACSRGLPDVIMCFFGRYIAFEIKNGQTARKPHEDLQNHYLKKIRRADGFGMVIRTIDEAMEALKKIREVC